MLAVGFSSPRCPCLAFLLATLAAAPGTAAAQAGTPAQATAWFRLERPAPAPALFILPDSVARKKDHTITGLLIGAGLGAALGYGFYNAMCEAVNNHCSGSRTVSVVVGAGLVGSLGALIGAVSSP
jgi:hypothetical protein